MRKRLITPSGIEKFLRNIVRPLLLIAVVIGAFLGYRNCTLSHNRSEGIQIDTLIVETHTYELTTEGRTATLRHLPIDYVHPEKGCKTCYDDHKR
jgi:hypothetical protein